LLPDDAEAHNILGAALKDLGHPDQAVTCYRRALEIKPDCAEAHNNLGAALKDLGQLDDAVICLRQALEFNPNFAYTHHNLGNVLRFRGEFDQSLDQTREAITIVLKEFRAHSAAFPGAPFRAYLRKKPMAVPSAHATLDLLRTRLNSAGIPWCLYAGTLLGVFRDGDVLPYDKDLDLALPAIVDRQQLIRRLTEAGGFHLHHRYAVHSEPTYRYSISFAHAEHGVFVDLFFLHQEGESHYLAGVDHPVQPILCRIRRFDFRLHPWRDGQWPIPSQPEQVLEDIYGKDWQHPDPGYDTVISNPCRIPQSIPVVLCYGYARLYNCLREHNWQGGRSYCRQLLARHPDPLLVEVDRWLAEQVSPR
jgi:hypothetical protein